MNKKTRLIILGVLGVLIVVVLSIGITRAFMKPVEETSGISQVSLSSCAKITLTDESSINLSNTYPMSKNRALQTTPYSFTVKSSCDTPVGFNLYLATLGTNTLAASKIHYIITNHGSKEILTDGIVGSAENVTSTFSDAEKTEYNVGLGSNLDNIYKLFNADIPFKGEATYDLYLYVDETATDAMNSTFNAGIAVKSYDREADPKLVDYIKGLYTTDGENSLYFHDVDLSNGARDSSYRYAGASPNNYVCFGTNIIPCPDDNLYRIIGVFNELNVDTNAKEERVKLIKAFEASENVLGKAPDGTAERNTTYYKGKLSESPGYYLSGSSSNSSNTWSSSTLNTATLNGTYLTNLGEYAKKIAKTRWHVGGGGDNQIWNVTPSVAYQNEVEAPLHNTTYDAKIGLMYVSEYGFAASPENWATNLNAYNTDTNRNNNWMFLGPYEWIISPHSATSSNAYRINTDSRVGYGGTVHESALVIRPSFSLEPSISYFEGLGTETDPIRIN